MIRSTLKRVLKRALGLPSEPTNTPPRPTPAVTEPTPPPHRAAATGRNLDEASLRGVIEEQIRPALQGDGGDIELVALDGRVAQVRLTGACNGCPSSSVTLKMGVEALLREEFPDLEGVVQVS